MDKKTAYEALAHVYPHLDENYPTNVQFIPLWIDTSMSISDERIREFHAEVRNIFDEFRTPMPDYVFEVSDVNPIAWPTPASFRRAGWIMDGMKPLAAAPNMDADAAMFPRGVK